MCILELVSLEAPMVAGSNTDCYRGSLGATICESSRTQVTGLAVESQEVVAVQARATDRRSMVETTMRPMPVVVVKPGLELVIAMLGSGINASVSPFAQSGLDEALGFAIGAWGIGAGEAMAQTQGENGVTESVGTITVAIIGEQPADANAQTGVVGEAGV